MKRTAIATLALSLIAGQSLATGSHAVRAHVTKKGTFVAPSRATNPDRSKVNNYSHRGNVNPANGKTGTKP